MNYLNTNIFLASIITYRFYIIGLFFLGTFFFFDFPLRLYRIEGESMAPTLKNGDFILTYHIPNSRFVCPEEWRKKIVLFQAPKTHTKVIKRAVLVPGDKVSIENGFLWNKEEPIFLTHAQYERLDHTPYVPKDNLFVVGDNYYNSKDSRDYGFISINSIHDWVIASF